MKSFDPQPMPTPLHTDVSIEIERLAKEFGQHYDEWCALDRRMDEVAEQMTALGEQRNKIHEKWMAARDRLHELTHK